MFRYLKIVNNIGGSRLGEATGRDVARRVSTDRINRP